MSKRAPPASFGDALDTPTSQWLPALRPLRRFRTYVLLAIFILAVYYTFHRSQPSSGSPFLRYDSIDWSRYAYSQYATSSAYLCNAVMVFEALHRLGSRAERILFYPEEWDTVVESSTDRNSQLLVMARDRYNVQLMPVKMPTFKEGPGLFEFRIVPLIQLVDDRRRTEANNLRRGYRECGFVGQERREIFRLQPDAVQPCPPP